MYRVIFPQPPAPSNATEHQMATRFYATPHGMLVMGWTPEEVMQLIDDYEVERNLPAASYIVFDRFEEMNNV